MPPADLVVGPDGLARCAWGAASEDYCAYHDQEWGRPVHGDRALFERLSLEAFQSGLSWITILRKREAFRAAFAGFEPAAVARFTPADADRLMADASIVRNRRKIDATIHNARVLVAMHDEHGDGWLDATFWAYARPESPRPQSLAEVAASTAESKAFAAQLKRAGWRHLGPTTAYAAMQACGVVDDHLAGCHAGRAASA